MIEVYLFLGFTACLAADAAVTAFLVKRHEEKRLGEFQDNILKKQRDEVQNIYSTMRGWRHDYHNHLQTIKAYLAMGQVGETLSYLEHLEDDLDSIDIAVRTGKNGIAVNCKAAVPDKLSVSDVHLCAIVGNLLDNAIEACGRVVPEKRFIRVYIGIFKQQLYISVSNSTDASRRKKLSELISNKQGAHGLGLKRIDRIVTTYDGFVNRKNEPGIFATEVLLPL